MFNVENLAAVAHSNDMVMSSREISDITGKKHFNVMRDIRSMLDGLSIEQNSLLSFDSSGANGRRVEFFNLPKDLCLTLVTGFVVLVLRNLLS